MLQLKPDLSHSLILFFSVDTTGRFLKWLGSVFQSWLSLKGTECGPYVLEFTRGTFSLISLLRSYLVSILSDKNLSHKAEIFMMNSLRSQSSEIVNFLHEYTQGHHNWMYNYHQDHHKEVKVPFCVDHQFSCLCLCWRTSKQGGSSWTVNISRY